MRTMGAISHQASTRTVKNPLNWMNPSTWCTSVAVVIEFCMAGFFLGGFAGCRVHAQDCHVKHLPSYFTGSNRNRAVIFMHCALCRLVGLQYAWLIYWASALSAHEKIHSANYQFYLYWTVYYSITVSCKYMFYCIWLNKKLKKQTNKQKSLATSCIKSWSSTRN